MFKLLTISCLLFASISFAQVNINTATVEELSYLSGIGEKKAKNILKYRKANGKFKLITDITNVKGIGKGILKKIKKDLKLSGKTDLTKIRPKVKIKKKVLKDKNKKKKTVKRKASEAKKNK